MEFTIETLPEDITVKESNNATTTTMKSTPTPQPVEEPKPKKETKEMEKINFMESTPYKRIKIGEGSVVYDANVTVILTAPANNVEMFFEVKTSKGRNGAFDAVNKFIRKNIKGVDFVTSLPKMEATWKNGQPVKGGYFLQKNIIQQPHHIWSSQDFIAAQEDMKASPKAQQKAPVQPQPTPAPIVKQPSMASVNDIGKIKDLVTNLGSEVGNGFERVLTLVGALNERIDKLEASVHTHPVKPSRTTAKKKAELQAELEAALAEIEQLKNNRPVESTNAELKAEVLRLKAENKTLQGAVASANAEVEKMRALEEQNKALEAKNKALQGAANANVELKAENERLTKDINELEAENQALQSEVYDLRQDLEKVTVTTTVTDDKSATVNDDKATVANDIENVTPEEKEFKALDLEAIIQKNVKKGFTGIKELKDAPLLEQLSAIAAVSNLSGHNGKVERIESVVNLYGIIKMIPHPFNDVIKYLAGVVNKKKSYVVEFGETSIVFENGDSLNLR